MNERRLNQNFRTILMTKKIFVPSIRPLEFVSVVRTDVLPGPGGIMSLQVILWVLSRTNNCLIVGKQYCKGY